MGFRRFLALFTIATFALACSDKSPTQPVSIEGGSASALATSPGARPATRFVSGREVPANGMIGTWGGPNLTMTVGAASTVIFYSCANGTIDQPFVTDAKGNFDLVGTHVPESPGPVRQGDPVVHPARYTGTVAGKTMTFTVTETDTGETVGKFVLTLGVIGRLFRCL